MAARYFEDYRVGEVVRAAAVTITESHIIRYAREYDPQPIHVDREAARRSIYGGLIASGWQVGALGFSMLVQAGLLGETSLGSPGIDELRWRAPVRPGDTLHAEAEILERRPSASKPDRGLVTVAYRIRNQAGEVVMSFRALQLVRRRPE
ncbi:MAG: MaoC family dehydratase [Candidatus Rokubacteria bacterium]|nr:MaoC family dehydratase [Candidatus Rokubacteria bacterium]